MNKFILPVVGITALVIISVLIFSSGRSPKVNQTSQQPSVHQTPKALNFQLQDYNGTMVKPSDFTGKALVINSWAAWCPFCKKELQDFAALQKEFRDNVVIIAIDRAEPLEVAKRYSDELGVMNELVFLLDPEDSFYQSIGGFSMPETIFVDAQGFIRAHKRGPMELDEMRQKIQSILN